jgi:cardiolipin synthase
MVISLLAYVITTRAERARRPPAAAIAWVLGMVALPYAALPMYLLFGRRKLARRHPQETAPRPASPHWADEFIVSFCLPPSAPSLVQFHRDGAHAYSGLLATMNGATRQLDVCTYILGNDSAGRAAVDCMILCAKRGVRVRFLIDGVGAWQVPRSWFRRLRANGVQTRVFSPLLARRTPGPRNLRNHRKWVIADGERLWAGGRNLAGEYFTGSGSAAPWLDLSFELAGPTAGAVGAQFEVDWRAAGGQAAAQIQAPTPEGGARTQFLPSGPDQMEDTVHALLIDGCYRATERILAVSPYFVPDVGLENALRLAARRGVRIDLCVPRRSNHALADFVRNRALRALCDAGASVHLLPHMNHAKAVVFDRSIALCGSCNLDSRSLLLNYESMVVFYGDSEIAWLAAWIGALVPGSEPFDGRSPSLWRDLAEGLLLSVAYQL